MRNENIEKIPSKISYRSFDIELTLVFLTYISTLLFKVLIAYIYIFIYLIFLTLAEAEYLTILVKLSLTQPFLAPTPPKT